MTASGATETRHEPMSKVDTAWLRMERPSNLMMITGVMMFADRLDPARFRKIVRERFISIPRFRQKAVDAPGGAYWQTDTEFDLDWHLRIAGLPGRAGKVELERLCSQLASTPLDASKPRWQFHLVEGYDGGSALITRVHHCYADGIALVQVLLSLTDVQPHQLEKAALAKVWFKEDPGSVLDRLLAPARKGISQAVHLAETVIDKGRELLADPEQLARLAHEGGEIARELAVVVSLSDDPPTRFRGPIGVSKRCAWADPLPLDEVKAVGQAFACTVNDVLLATAAGALRRYLINHGDDPDGITIRATVPVNLRPLEHAKKLGNHFGLVFLELPIGEANPLARLTRVVESMREIKQSRQAVMAFGLLAALGMCPAAILGPALEMFSRKASTVATNVPGPQMPLYLAGSRIESQMFWVPQTGSIGMGISILSYDGQVYFGLITDAKRVADPEALVALFRLEFEKLLLLALMAGSVEPLDAAQAEALLLRFEPAAAPKPKTRPKPGPKPVRAAAGRARATALTAPDTKRRRRRLKALA